MAETPNWRRKKKNVRSENRTEENAKNIEDIWQYAAYRRTNKQCGPKRSYCHISFVKSRHDFLSGCDISHTYNIIMRPHEIFSHTTSAIIPSRVRSSSLVSLSPSAFLPTPTMAWVYGAANPWTSIVCVCKTKLNHEYRSQHVEHGSAYCALIFWFADFSYSNKWNIRTHTLVDQNQVDSYC